jgi:anaerobic magnesium-protoporphyrin IX monomethyl ester cyclase
MKIVLATLNAKYIHASLALRYLKAFSQPEFPNIEIVEFTIKDVPLQMVSELYQRQPDVVAFSVYIWNVEETIPVIQTLKKVLPNVRIVLGGPEVSYDTVEWMQRIPEVDFIVQGEGEATFHHLLQEIRGEERFNEVNGIAYRSEGKVIINPPRAKLALNQIPSPYQDEEDIRGLRNRIVYFETSRGCPFSCQFCLSSIESGVRYFDLDRVKSELKKLIDAGIRTIKFVDRTFNLNRKYALELFQFLIDHRGETVFQFEITGDILPPDIVEFLAKNAPKGLFRFEIGVQSTNDVTNTLVKRRQNFEKLSRTVLSIKQSGKIVQHLDLIAGLPEEDYASFKKTFNDVFAFEPEELQLGFLKMLRGTGLRERAKQHEYVYMDRAPYEILRNNVLSFDDVLRIKQVEDVLEKYWNSGKLRRTVQYLVRHVFPSPFDFFQSFGAYWEGRGWSRIGHQFEDLFLRLDEFLRESATASECLAAESIMMYEFLVAHRIRPHKVWWTERMSKREKNQLLELIAQNPRLLGPEFAELCLDVNSLDKHAVFERLPVTFDVDDPEQRPIHEPMLLLVYYPPGLEKGEQPLRFTAPLGSLELV